MNHALLILAASKLFTVRSNPAERCRVMLGRVLKLRPTLVHLE